MSEAIYKAVDVIRGEIPLKTTPQVIMIRDYSNRILLQAVTIALEHGYKVIASYTRPGGFRSWTNLILEREK